MARAKYFTKDEIIEAREMLRSRRIVDVAEHFECTFSCMWKIKQRKTHKDVY